MPDVIKRKRKRGRPPKQPTPAAAVEAALLDPAPRKSPIPDKDLLSTGCAVLNLAFSDRACGGIPKGNYVHAVGDTGTLKSWLGFNLFAEAAINPVFDKYHFVFDNAENGVLMDVARYFGRAVAERVRPPKGTVKKAQHTRTVKQLYLNIALNCHKPCVYLLDSLSALVDDAEDDIFTAELKRYQEGSGAVPKTMGMGAAKTNSRTITRLTTALRDSGSIAVLISQTRNKVGAPFPMKTSAGGDALKFFAHLQIWTSSLGDVTNRYNKKDRVVGTRVKVDVRKNRITGGEDAVVIRHLKNTGLDDLGTSVEYLLGETYWKFTKAGKEDDDSGAVKSVTAPEFDFEGHPEKLIQLIQEQGREAELQDIVQKVWQDIRANSAPARKIKYS